MPKNTFVLSSSLYSFCYFKNFIKTHVTFHANNGIKMINEQFLRSNAPMNASFDLFEGKEEFSVKFVVLKIKKE